MALIERCNKARERFGADVLAKLVAVDIAGHRPGTAPRHLPKTAFIIRQLKHKEEVYKLRSIYAEGLHIVGLYAPEQIRRRASVDFAAPCSPWSTKMG
jgi:hypothetical protein